jgi:hypothetical protein
MCRSLRLFHVRWVKVKKQSAWAVQVQLCPRGLRTRVLFDGLGRNFHALLVHEFMSIASNKLPWDVVFEWAVGISDGSIVYISGEAPDRIIALAAQQIMDASG